MACIDLIGGGDLKGIILIVEPGKTLSHNMENLRIWLNNKQQCQLSNTTRSSQHSSLQLPLTFPVNELNLEKIKTVKGDI